MEIVISFYNHITKSLNNANLTERISDIRKLVAFHEILRKMKMVEIGKKINSLFPNWRKW